MIVVHVFGGHKACQSHEFYHHYFNLYSTSVPSEIPIMTHSQTGVVIKLDIIIFLLITLHPHSTAQGIISLNKHKVRVLLLISVLYFSCRIGAYY